MDERGDSLLQSFSPQLWLEGFYGAVSFQPNIIDQQVLNARNGPEDLTFLGVDSLLRNCDFLQRASEPKEKKELTRGYLPFEPDLGS